MITVISRIIHFGLKNFWRNGLLSTATVAIVTLSLLVFAGLILSNAITTQMISYLQDKIDISVYFKTNTPEDEILKIQNSISKLSEVKSVDYVSADQALEKFKQDYSNNQNISQSLTELGSNPLEASLNIKAYDPSKYSSIADYLGGPSLNQYIDTVSYSNSKNRVVIDRLVAIIAGVNRAGVAATIFLSLIAGLVVFNTIRLVIYSNRDEIGIMRAVGASNALVRGPYVVEGAVIGFISAVLALFLVLLAMFSLPFVYHGSSYFQGSLPGFSLSGYLSENFFSFIGYLLLFGVGLTGISSFIAVRRYLKR